jgi:hypothetical protein
MVFILTAGYGWLNSDKIVNMHSYRDGKQLKHYADTAKDRIMLHPSFSPERITELTAPTIPAQPGFALLLASYSAALGTSDEDALDFNDTPIIGWRCLEHVLEPITIERHEPTSNSSFLTETAIKYPDGRVWTYDGEYSSVKEWQAEIRTTAERFFTYCRNKRTRPDLV